MPKNKNLPRTAKKMFTNYLYRVGINPSKLHPIQFNEMRKTHYAALASLILVMTDAGQTEDELFNFLDDLNKEVTSFWIDETQAN